MENFLWLNILISFQAIRAEVLDHRPHEDSSPTADPVAAATLNIDEILELCADYERQIDEEQVENEHKGGSKVT